jgi:hypothetical protein
VDSEQCSACFIETDDESDEISSGRSMVDLGDSMSEAGVSDVGQIGEPSCQKFSEQSWKDTCNGNAAQACGGWWGMTCAVFPHDEYMSAQVNLPACFPALEVGATYHGPGMLTSYDHDIGPEALQQKHETESRTTVHIRNLPNNYSKKQVLALLDKMGFAGSYDFFYLPYDFRRGFSLGYAFVNFTCGEKALECFHTFGGFSSWPRSRSKKVCMVGWSHQAQGYEANVERWRDSTIMLPSVPEEYKPSVFEKGVLKPFPASERTQ